MKPILRFIAAAVIVFSSFSIALAQTTYTLNPLTSFGTRGDGSIQPGDTMGISPMTGYPVIVSAPGVTNAWFPNEPILDQRPTGSTNGFNMRGLTWDPISHNLIFIDTHSGSGGSGIITPFSAIYILDQNSGAIIGALNTNGIVGGSYSDVVPGVSDDGVVYVCNQTTASQTLGLKIYRWSTADTNNPNFNAAPIVAFTNILNPSARWGETMDVRGSGTNTQIILGAGTQSGVSTVTNVLLLTTTDGTNFTARYLSFPGITTGVFNDGIAFGPENTFFAKQVGQPLLFLRFDPNQFTNNLTVYTNNGVISSFAASSVNDPLLNISAISYDPVRKLLGGLEEIGGTATGGRGKVWLFHIPDPTNKAPSVLASRTYIPNFQKTLAPMGYIRFSTNGLLYAHASNNGFLVSTVDSVPLSAPTFSRDLPGSTRIAEGQTAHFEVSAVVDVTSYQWYSNNVPISGATTYFYDILNVTTNSIGVFKVVASNAAGSSTSVSSTLQVISAANFFHPVQLWSVAANSLVVSNPTNFITTVGVNGSVSGTPNERTIAYNALSNQLLVVRGPSLASLKIFVVDADRGSNGATYVLKTNGITPAQNVTLAGIGVADDGAVYAAAVASDSSFKIYRWANTDPNTLPVTIFGTNSSAASSNPIADLLGSQAYRFGDVMAVRGSGNNTELLLDSHNPTKYASILQPTPDGTMTNWTETASLLQNVQGSYGSEAYGTTIGRSIQFGTGNSFYQKRYNAAAGAPLALMNYNPGGGIATLAVANTSPGLFTNGEVAVNSTLGVAAAINYVGGVGGDSAAQDTLIYYDFTDPAQAVLLSTAVLPQGGTANGHKANVNALGNIIFGANPVTGTNYIFVIDANNGVAAYVLSGGVTPPPKIVSQPRNLRLLEGGSGSLAVAIDQIAAVRWLKGTNSPVDTGVSGTAFSITNATTSNAGDYFVIATNLNGAVTSLVARVTVGFTNDNYTLTGLWTAIAGNGSFPYVTTDGGANTPNERSFAYNALSNQLIVVRCPPASTSYTLWVVDGTTGANLYTLNTSGVIHEGASEVTGSNPIDLVGVAVAADGAIYICSESPNASGGSLGDTTKMFHVFRWANSAAATAPVLVYQGDPSGQPAGINLRWGDAMAARGSGTNTELIVNSQDGSYAAILKPIDSTLNAFTNFWFGDSSGGGSIGRSLQFGLTNTVYEKRKGSALVLSSYNTSAQSSSGLLSVDSSTTLGGVAVDASRNLMIGVDFVGSTTPPAKADAVALYDISDSTSPLLINRYNFPAVQVANANVICQTVIVGSKVYSLDANNGLMAFYINAPVNSMVLKIVPAGSNVNLSWGNSAAILQGTPDLTGPSTWTDLSTVGQTNSVQSSTNGIRFYRLIVRR